MRKLTRKIKKRVNQLTQLRAAQYATALRDSMLAELQRLADDGAAMPEMDAALDEIEASADWMGNPPAGAPRKH